MRSGRSSGPSPTGAPDYRAGAIVTLAGITDRGRQRSTNEDSLVLDEATGLAVVADGVGGESAGEVASAIASQVVRDAVRKRLLAVAGDYVNTIRLRQDELGLVARAALLDAHCEVLDNAKVTGRDGMASTATLAFVHAGVATIAWAGDSSAFLFRDGKLTQLTRSHSLEEDMYGGKAGAGRRLKGPLTMVAGGSGEPFMPEVRYETIRPGDVLLLCSDGLTDMLEDARIGRIIGRHNHSLDAAATALVAAANEAGGKDNITVALIGVLQVPGWTAAERAPSPARSIAGRILRHARPAAMALVMVGLIGGSALTMGVATLLDSRIKGGVDPKQPARPSEPEVRAPRPRLIPALPTAPSTSTPEPELKSAETAVAPPSEAPASRSDPGQDPPLARTQDRAKTMETALDEAAAPSPAADTTRGKTDRKKTAKQEGTTSAASNTPPPAKGNRPEKAASRTEEKQ